MLKFKLHPLTVFAAVILVWQGRLAVALSYLCAVLVHELGHAYSARRRGYYLGQIVLMPYGAVLYGWEDVDKKHRLHIAVAGVAASLLLCTVLYAGFWIYPASYYWFSTLNEASLTIAVFNLLPVFPLDGSRAVLAVCKNKERALKGLKISGAVFATIMFAVSLFTIRRGYNFTLSVMAVFLFTGAVSGTEKERYFHVLERVSPQKRSDVPLEYKTMLIGCDTTMLRVLGSLDAASVYTFMLVDEKQEVLAEISEPQMRKALEKYPLGKKAGEIFISS